VIDELEYLKTCTNVKTFAMIDENFFFRTNEDLESFVIEYNNKIKLPLVFHGDFRTHDYNLKIKIISGLKPHFTLLLGVQTGSEKFNKRVYNRTQNIQNTLLKLNYTNRIFKIAKCNYNISLNLIYAHPLEKKEDIIKTINFMLQADVRDYGIYAYLHPPHLENENLIIEKSTNFGLPSYKLFKRHAFYYFLIFLIYYLKRRKLDFLLPSRIDYLPILRIFDVQLFSKLYYLIVLFGNIKYQIILNNETLALMKNAK
jgi:hypothetical protein